MTMRTTRGRGRLFESILETIGDTPTIAVGTGLVIDAIQDLGRM